MEARKKALNYIDSNGFFTKENTLTKGKYLEIYSWEYMLDHSNDPVLETARKMREKGLLDCYVLITCYHYDFYQQFLDFSKSNRQRILDYLKGQIETR